jgi:hypothetical protein
MGGAIGGIIGGAGSIIGSLIGAGATKKAASQAANAADAATAAQLEMYYQTREDQAPWRTAGTEAVNTLLGKVMAGPGEYTKSPYYNFLMGEGTKALERGAAARGRQLSGAQAKALEGYGQNLASTDYDKWLGRWYQSLTPYQSLAGLGQTSVAQTGQAGAQAAANMVAPQLYGGSARAAGTLGMANTLQNLIPWGVNMLGGGGALYGGGPFPGSYNEGIAGGFGNTIGNWLTPYGQMYPSSRAIGMYGPIEGL